MHRTVFFAAVLVENGKSFVLPPPPPDISR